MRIGEAIDKRKKSTVMYNITVDWAKKHVFSAGYLPAYMRKPRLSFLGEVLGVALLVLLDTTCGIDEFLLSSEVRMTFRTDLHLDFILCGAHFKCCATGTSSS